MDRNAVSERLTGVLVSELGLDADKINDQANFEEDLDVSSFDWTPDGSSVVFQAAEGFPRQPIITGTYVDRCEKGDDTWRFAERRELVAQTGDLSAHLLQSFEGPTGQ